MSKQDNSNSKPKSVNDGNRTSTSSGYQVRPSDSCLSCNSPSGTKRKVYFRPPEPEILEDYDDIKEEFASPVFPRKKRKPTKFENDLRYDSDSESVEDKCTDPTELDVYDSESLLRPGKSFLVKDSVDGASSLHSNASQESLTDHTRGNFVENCDLSKIFKLSPKQSEVKKQKTVRNGNFKKSKPQSGADNSAQFHDIRQHLVTVMEMFPHLEDHKIKKIFDELLEIDEDNIVERVVENILTSQVSTEEIPASQDVQAALGDPRPGLCKQGMTSYSNPYTCTTPNQSDESRKKCVPGRKWRKGRFISSSKGKAPAQKPQPQQMFSCDSNENVMESDMDDSAEGNSSGFHIEASMETPTVDQNPSNCAERVFPLLKCDACGASQDTAAISQCCKDHLICRTCVEKQVKKVISPESHETQISCPTFGCSTYIPESQASRVLPSLIMELLEEKLNKKAMESITQMEDLHSCPFCKFPVAVDHELKKFMCPNQECMKLSCRYCKKIWSSNGHHGCTAFMALSEESKEHLELPKYWHPMPSDQKDFILVELDRSGREYTMIKNLFCTSMKKVSPISIRRIQNPRLWQKFSLTRKHMAEEFDQNVVNEQQLFHGTKGEAIEAICRDGLDWRMCGENGVAFGQGTYFAKHAKYSDTYCLPYTGQNAPLQSRVVHIKSVSNAPNSHYNISISNVFGPTVTLQGTGGQASTPGSNPYPIGPPNYITQPHQPHDVNALHGIGAQTGFGTITIGTPFGATAQNPQTSSTSTSSAISDVPKVTSEVGQILRVQHKYMFVARVLVGRSGQGRPGTRKPPEDPTDPKGRPFNSCVNFPDKPSIFVIFDSTQCYPEYLIEYVYLNSRR